MLLGKGGLNTRRFVMVKEYIEEKECRKLNQEFSENLKDYQNRSANLTG